MKIFGENSANDLFLGTNNQLVIRTGIDATLQACESAIEAQRGEMQYEVTRGIPTEDTVWAGIPNQQRFRFFCTQALLEVPGVIEVTRFTSDLIGDTLEYSAEIVAEGGTGTIGSLFNGSV